MEYIPYISGLLGVIVSVLAFLKANRKEQTELDKEQDGKIGALEQRVSIQDERMTGMTDRMNRMDQRQDQHESKTETALGILNKKIDEMPMKIVELIKGMK